MLPRILVRNSAAATIAATLLLLSLDASAPAQTPTHYLPTVASLDARPVPQWYNDAKLGIFIVWGLYSVPAWAPLKHKEHDFANNDFIMNTPYAEWYYNVSRIPGSPTEAYNREHYGADHNYYDFAKQFNEQAAHWDADKMAAIVQQTGAKYVVFTAKFHDGYLLWPSKVPNPDQRNITATRDLVGDMKTAMEKRGIKLGLYYSGGFDWTFNRGPIERNEDYEATKPETQAYGRYADAQIEELIKLYHPAVLWNDIDWPRTGHPLQLFADYYNAVPDGVVDDRFTPGRPPAENHSDFFTAEYFSLHETSKRKWEANRGVGLSFGYNRAEGEADTISAKDLIHLFVDVVSKNGNLLLDVGPEADGTIPAIQLDRIRALGDWMHVNSEAIYATKPWWDAPGGKPRSEGTTDQGIDVRFTRKDANLYAILLDKPHGSSITLRGIHPAPGSAIALLGGAQPLAWKQAGDDIAVQLPRELPDQYAYALRIVLP
jgi:alpha-L-fucosidase